MADFTKHESGLERYSHLDRQTPQMRSESFVLILHSTLQEFNVKDCEVSQNMIKPKAEEFQEYNAGMIGVHLVWRSDFGGSIAGVLCY